MKRTIAMALVFSLLLGGCGFFGERIKEPVTLYYLCDKYQEELCCVIVSEEREASGHRGDLSYLLALYRMGPVSEEMVSPLGRGIGLTGTQEEGRIILELTGLTDSMTDIDFTLACTCLTLTCLETTDAQSVTVQCGDRSKRLTRESLTLYDNVAQPTATEEP